jgi:hypothetical protein
VIPLEDYTMETNYIYRHEHDWTDLYSKGNARESGSDSFFRPDLEAEDYSVLSLRDTGRLLKRMEGKTGSERTLSDRVFGGQLRRGRVSIENSDKLIFQREELLKRAIREIDERRNVVMNRLSVALRPYSGRTPQEVSRVERTLLDLESERRDAYLQFWKDAATEQKELLEIAAEYLAARDRASLLDGTASAYDSVQGGAPEGAGYD